MTPSSSLREKVLADAAAHRARTRAQGRRRAALIYAIGALASLPLFFAWGGVEHGASRPFGMTLGIALGGLLIAVACAAVAWWRGTTLGRTSTALVAVAVLAPIATYAWLVSWHGRYDEPAQHIGFRCLAMTLASGAPLLAAAIYVRKRTVAVHPVASGAALGAAAGALGSVTVDLWCPLTNAPHVLIGHALPIAVLALLGATLGRGVPMIRSLLICAAFAAVACVHESEHAAVTAQLDGDDHVLVRAEYGRVWWQRCAWSEPHELWALPSNDPVEDLHVTRGDAGLVVTFHQHGRAWSGSFNPDPKHASSAALANR
jgi:hypothetical protein